MNIFNKIASIALFAVFSIAPVFAYGGGGGGGLNFSNPNLLPTISRISPLKSSLQSSSFPISFVVQGNPDEDSIIVEVNGEKLDTTISPLGGGTLEVLAHAEDITGDSAFIKISAASRYSASSIRSYLYPVSILQGSESPSLISVHNSSENSENSPLQYEVILFNKELKQNLCDEESAFNENTYSSEIKYSDISGDKNEKYIRDLTARCIVNGEGNNTFRPNKIFNRAAAVKTVIRGFGYQYDTAVSQDPFVDVRAFEWFAPYLSTAKKYGIVRGYTGGKFSPDKGMNIVEGLAIVARASRTDLSDYQMGSGIWYNPYLKWGIDKGLVDKDVKPDTPLSRGAFARMVSLR